MLTTLFQALLLFDLSLLCLTLMVMADALEHGVEFLPFIVLEAEDDEQTFGDLERPVEALVVLTANPEIVARDVVEALGGMVQDGHLMMEGQGNPAAVAYLLTETDAVIAKDLPAAFAEFQAEVEINPVDEE